jgi:hypothetical protein
MKARVQVKAPARATAAPAAARLPQPPDTVPDRADDQPDVAAQLASATCLGHSFAALDVNGATPPSLQLKLVVGPVGDRYEREAGRGAGQTLHLHDGTAPAAAQSVQRQEAWDTTIKGEAEASGEGGGAPEVRQENRTGLPDNLKAGLENLSGLAMDDVRVHYNSSKPAEISAHAFTQGKDIQIASGQETHLPHEGWHVVQQAQGRVKPTMQLKDGVPVNDDQGLEHEADVMGAKALQMRPSPTMASEVPGALSAPIGISGEIEGLNFLSTTGAGAMAAREPAATSAGLQLSNKPVLQSLGSSGGGVVQRVRDLEEGTYVEVNDGGPPWYGQIDSVLEDGYNVRVGGTGTVKKVPFDQVTVHPSFSASAEQIAEEIFQSAGSVNRAGPIQTLVEHWSSTTENTHNPMLTLKFMMVCKALSTNRRITDLLARDQHQVVQDVVAALELLVDSRQIIQEWNDTAQDIEARGQAWDFFLDGVDALSDGKGNLEQYFYTCLVHDKGYGQTHEATQNYLLLIGQQQEVQDDPFDSVLRAALAQNTNSNIWVGGHKGAGKLRDQLARGFEQQRLETIPAGHQEEQMWGSLLTALITAHSPGRRDWTYAKVIRKNGEMLFTEIDNIVPGELHRSALNEALELMGA